MSKPAFTYEMILFSGKHFALTDRDYADVKQKLAKGVPVLVMPDGSLVSKGNIASVEKRQMTMADMGDGKPQLPAGTYSGDTSGPGYQKFLQAWKKFNPKGYAQHMRDVEAKKQKEGDK